MEFYRITRNTPEKFEQCCRLLKCIDEVNIIYQSDSELWIKADDSLMEALKTLISNDVSVSSATVRADTYVMNIHNEIEYYSVNDVKRLVDYLPGVKVIDNDDKTVTIGVPEGMKRVISAINSITCTQLFESTKSVDGKNDIFRLWFNQSFGEEPIAVIKKFILSLPGVTMVEECDKYMYIRASEEASAVIKVLSSCGFRQDCE